MIFLISREKAVKWVVCAVLITFLITALGTGYLILFTGPLGKLTSIIRTLDFWFYKDIDWDKIVEGAARGIIYGMDDPYSYYMSEEEWEEYRIESSGEYSGIGIKITVIGKEVVIVAVAPGEPGERAGIEFEDVILAVNGQPVSDSLEAARLVRGPAGTTVDLTIKRGNDVFDVTIERTDILIPSLDYQVIDGNIGYIQFYSFYQHSYNEMRMALADLTQQEVECIILDLRGNGGGYFDPCILICELFVPEGDIVKVEYKNKPSKLYQSASQGLGMPLVVLVDTYSGSASEILTGAVQDRGVGVVIGTRTYGKGLVQGMFQLADGAVMKVTTAQYVTPAGRYIDGIGLEPDIVVEDPDEQMDKALEVAKSLIAGD